MRILFVWVMLMVLSGLCAQETSPYTKFGKITIQDLQKKSYSIDSNASAVVLSDIGKAGIEGNNKGWFSITFTRHRVVHILNRNGYAEANVEIFLYTDGDNEEKIDNIKAVTYNLEKEKITETKLDKSSLFREKVDKNRVIRKFTFPNVREGSIVEYEYKVTSDYIQNLDPWHFQGPSPVLWSEYTLSVPQFFTYAFAAHGYRNFSISDRKDKVRTFAVVIPKGVSSSETVSISAGVSDYRWVMKDVPELKEESFTSSIRNHLSRIEFQLSSQTDPLVPHDYRNTWPGLTKELLESEHFGRALDHQNYWLSDDLKPVLAGIHTQTDKARKIYAFVRNNFVCTDHSALYTDQTLKNVMKLKKGSISEVNLLLTAMLRFAGLQADPVILSTTRHGYALKDYPMITNFNYVITKCTADGKNYFLDATHPKMGFGRLSPECYNGHARVINETADPVYFQADSLKEKKLTAIFISNGQNGKRTAKMSQTLGYYESDNVRDKVQGKGKDDFFKEIQKAYGDEARINSPVIDSLDQYDEPLALKYSIDLPPLSDEIEYLNPMFGEAWKKNPFESAERYYPVEMPYTMDETYLLTMEIPEGYVLDELPKQLVAKLDEKGSASFEYRITQSGSTLSLKTQLKISRTFFTNNEYDHLREFFNLVVKKQNEQIVFKKKNK